MCFGHGLFHHFFPEAAPPLFLYAAISYFKEQKHQHPKQYWFLIKRKKLTHLLVASLVLLCHCFVFCLRIFRRNLPLPVEFLGDVSEGVVRIRILHFGALLIEEPGVRWLGGLWSVWIPDSLELLWFASIALAALGLITNSFLCLFIVHDFLEKDAMSTLQKGALEWSVGKQMHLPFRSEPCLSLPSLRILPWSVRSHLSTGGRRMKYPEYPRPRPQIPTRDIRDYILPFFREKRSVSGFSLCVRRSKGSQTKEIKKKQIKKCRTFFKTIFSLKIHF